MNWGGWSFSHDRNDSPVGILRGHSTLKSRKFV
jgi:hypothetical protein